MVVNTDSVEWLKARKDRIDILYLDSADKDGREEEQRCLAEFQAAEPHLSTNALVCVDDTVFDGKWKGLGALLVPFLLGKGFMEGGWKVKASGYQVVLSRR